VALLGAASVCSAAERPSASPIDAYQAAGQALLAGEIVPTLARVASGVDAPREVSAVVTASRDPLDVGVEVDSSGARRLTISAGFLMFLDSLIEAEVSARLLRREDLLPAYREDVVRFAGVATRAEPGVLNPGRFFRRLGLTSTEYAALAGERDFQKLRSDNMVQSLAWIAAHHLTVGPARPDATLPPRADRAAADWTWAAGFAPFPVPGAAMLYFAALDPRENDPNRLRCRTQGALEISLRLTREAAGTPGRLPRTITEEQLARWSALVAGVAPAGSCIDGASG
jgi:hypothetical protein